MVRGLTMSFVFRSPLLALLLAAGTVAPVAPAVAQTTAPELAAASDLLAAEQFDAARKMLLELQGRTPNDPEVQAQLGQIAFELRAYKAAVRRFERAVALAPGAAEYHFLLGRALTGRISGVGFLKKPGVARRMKAAFEQAIRLDPGHARARLALVSFLANAPGIIGGSKKRARAEAELIKGIDPASYRRARARIAFADGRRAEAFAHYRASLEARFDKRTATEFGAVLENEKRWQEALTVLGPVIARRSQGATPLFAFFFYGRVAATSGRELEAGGRALDHFIAADERRKSKEVRPQSHFLRGRIHERLGQTAAARSAYKKALEADKGHKAARRALKRLRGADGGG